jgi:hypothetical protein
MNAKEPQVDSSEDAISRRRMLKRIGTGAAVAWSAPILTSIRTPAFAQSPPNESPCDPGHPCDVPCDPAIPCKDQNPACECWVRVDGQGCWCGDLDPCSNHTPCNTNADCLPLERCIENCCGKLCYKPCSAAAGARAPKNAGYAHGIRPT